MISNEVPLGNFPSTDHLSVPIGYIFPVVFAELALEFSSNWSLSSTAVAQIDPLLPFLTSVLDAKNFKMSAS